MAEMSAGRVETTSSVAWWRDERKRGLIAQLLVIAVLLLGIYIMSVNMADNLRRLGIPLGLDFLSATAGFDISFSLTSVNLDSSIGQMILAGILNTLLASAISIVLATILGFLVGVLRLSKNYLISRIATTYIEVVRNVPLLVQLLFWYVAVVQLLPNIKESVSLFDAFFISKRGLYMPRPVLEEGSAMVIGAFFIAIIVAVGIRRWAKARQIATGQQFPAFSVGFGVIILLPLLVSMLLGNPVSWDVPQLAGFNFKGGVALQPEMTALLLGLSVYTGSFIAEIVRGGILAVSHGQTEAALALGLKQSWTLRLVIIPQAMRVIIPPLTSQYLNVAKNSTLAGIIGYPDLYSVIGTSQNQTGRAVECVAILMLFFLCLSLLISLFMNWYNKRIALVER